MLACQPVDLPPHLPSCLQDLLTDEPFTRKDIMHLQDPLNVSGRLISEFHHVRFVSIGTNGHPEWLLVGLVILSKSAVCSATVRVLHVLPYQTTIAASLSAHYAGWHCGGSPCTQRIGPPHR